MERRGESVNGGHAKPSALTVRHDEMALIGFVGVSIAVAVIFPYPLTKYVLLIVLGISYLFLLLQRFELALCLVPFIIPAQNLVPPDLIPVPGLNYETAVILLLCLGWMSYRGRAGSPPPGRMPALGKVVAVFLIVIAVSALRSMLQYGFGLWDLFSSFKNQFIYLFIYFIVADVLRAERHRARLMVAISVAMIVLAVKPVWESTVILTSGASLESHRVMSLLAMQPNIYGGALAVFLPFPLAYLARKLGGKQGTILWISTLLIGGYALVLTLSRGSWLALAAAVAVAGVVFERRILLILLVCAALGPLWIPGEAIDRAETMSMMDLDDPYQQEKHASSFIRVDQWRLLFPMLMDAPVFGHGYGTFPYLYGRHGATGEEKGAHVGYVEYAVEQGIPGLFMYVMIFLAISALGFRLARNGSTEFQRAHGVALVAAAVAMIVAECFGSRFKVGGVTAFLWMYAGVAAAMIRWPVNETMVEKQGNK